MRGGPVAVALLLVAARVDAMATKRAAGTMTEPQVKNVHVQYDEAFTLTDGDSLTDGQKQMEYVMAAYEACQWEPAGTLKDVTNRYRELEGEWNSSESLYNRGPFMGTWDYTSSAAGTKKSNLSDTPAEVCFVPKRIVLGWDGVKDAGDVEEHIVFTRTVDPITLPAGISFAYQDYVPAKVFKPATMNRFFGASFDWFVDEHNELPGYPPLHPHHVEATACGWPEVDGLSTFNPFLYLSLRHDSQWPAEARPPMNPNVVQMCEDTNMGTLSICGKTFTVPVSGTKAGTVSSRVTVPAGADFICNARIDNVRDEDNTPPPALSPHPPVLDPNPPALGPSYKVVDEDYTGRFVSMRQYFLTKPVKNGGAAILSTWSFRFKIDGLYQLAITPSAGPSIAAHSYYNPRAGTFLMNENHQHPGVDNENWFIVGRHISELVPPQFLKNIHTPYTSQPYKDAGDELSVPSDLNGSDIESAMGPLGDVATLILDGTGWTMEELKAYILERLPDSMLRCQFHSEPIIITDGVEVSPPSVLDTEPVEKCKSIYVAEGDAITVIGFYQNNTTPDYYGMHSSIFSYVVFDDDPFVEM